MPGGTIRRERNNLNPEAWKLDTWTLERKVGQLFALTHKGTGMSEQSRQLIAGKKLGGIFLNIDSLRDPEQVYRLTSELQAAALGSGNGVPLFISADFVAGAGCKLQGGAVHFPKNRALGAADDESLAYESGKITALESLAMGVNFNYSPVVDINNNPLNPVIGTHSFGEDRDRVAEMGEAVIRGYQEHGMIATAKHFPGHGDTNVDSHFDLPVLPFDRERLEAFELEPFRRAIAAGVDAVMVGHIAVPSLDPSMLPASLSHAMTTGILRKELGFEGLIVTDGLSMKGVTGRFTQAEACVLAVKAGADILLALARTTEEAAPMVGAVLEAVRSGDIPMERLDESVARILKAKAKYGLLSGTFRQMAYDSAAFNRPDYVQVALKLAQAAATPAGGFKPLDKSDIGAARWTFIGEKQLERLTERVRAAGIAGTELVMDSYEELPSALERGAPAGPLLVALTHNKRMKASALLALDRFAAERPDVPVVLLHFGSQYDLEHVPHVPALVLYDRAPALQDAAADIVLGRAPLHERKDG